MENSSAGRGLSGRFELNRGGKSPASDYCVIVAAGRLLYRFLASGSGQHIRLAEHEKRGLST